MSKLFLVSSLILGTLATTAYADGGAGGKEGGGGGAVILSNENGEQVVVADGYIKKQGTAYQVSAPLLNELKLAGRLLARFGADTGERTIRKAFEENLIAKFISDFVLNPNKSEIRLVDEVPMIGDCEAMDVILPSNATYEPRFACTQGRLSWIKRDLFESMSVIEQVRAIVHERAHALYGHSQDVHEQITALTTGLGVALTLWHEQSEGKRPYLNQDQVSAIAGLYKSLGLLGIRRNKLDDCLGSVVVWPNGGGFVNGYNHDEKGIDPTAYFGIGSHVDSYTWAEKGRTIDRGVEVLDSYFNSSGMLTIKIGTRVKNSVLSSLYDTVLDEGVSVENSVIRTTKRCIHVASGVKIKNSTLVDFGDLNIDRNADLSGFQMIIRVSDRVGRNGDVMLLNRLNPIEVYVGENALVKNVALDVKAGWKDGRFSWSDLREPKLTINRNASLVGGRLDDSIPLGCKSFWMRPSASQVWDTWTINAEGRHAKLTRYSDVKKYCSN